MNGQAPQQPQNWHEATLLMFRWACRIQVACLLLFACGCLGFLGVLFFIRLVVWLYEYCLAVPW